jgi:hypothetical protein
MTPAIRDETEWLRNRENSTNIPRDELLSHNAFLRLIVRTYSTQPPDADAMDRLVSFYAQELISAWLYPMTPLGSELYINDSADDTRLYHERYPLLARLSAILRYCGAGGRVARIIGEWLDMKWQEIRSEPEVEALYNIDYELDPPPYELNERQEKCLRATEFLALFPIVYFGPQDTAAEDLDSRLNADCWEHPGLDRLKLWLNIPELWNLQVYLVELHTFHQPFRRFQRIFRRPLLSPIIFVAAEFVGFALQLFRYIRIVEVSTPGPELIHGVRYWYEEVFCASAIHWNFHLFKFPGQYIQLFEKPFVSIIRGYIWIFGPETLSDLIVNMVFLVSGKTLPVRVVIARTVMNELLQFGGGYEFLTEQAKAGLNGLMYDETGRLAVLRRPNPALEGEPMRGTPPTRR